MQEDMEEEAGAMGSTSRVGGLVAAVRVCLGVRVVHALVGRLLEELWRRGSV